MKGKEMIEIILDSILHKTGIYVTFLPQHDIECFSIIQLLLYVCYQYDIYWKSTLTK